MEETLERQRREMMMDKKWLEQEEKHLVRDHTHKHTHNAARFEPQEFSSVTK